MIARKAKVTDEHRQEAARLAALWDTRAHPSQAIFGEQYEIGSQSAVGQFLRGDTPLSLKAAAGFASGLGCKISDFSIRLARQALTYADLSGLFQEALDLTQLSKIETQLVLSFRELSPSLRAEMLQVIDKLRTGGIELERATPPEHPVGKDPSYATPTRKSKKAMAKSQ